MLVSHGEQGIRPGRAFMTWQSENWSQRAARPTHASPQSVMMRSHGSVMSYLHRLAPVGAVALAVVAPLHAEAMADDPIEEQMAAALSEGGATFAAGVDWDRRPEYGLWARIEPDTGQVMALMSARLPVGAAAESVTLRWFPGVVADHAEVTALSIDGAAVTPAIEDSIITLPLPAGHAGSVQLMVAFGFTADELSPAPVDPMAGGDSLEPAAIGLLGTTADAVTLGHWFPVWVPDGLDADPDLDGFGDISNFPAARIHAILDVPASATVVTSGVRLDEQPGETGRTIITEGAIGLRDLSIVVMPDADQVEVAAGAVNVVVSAPAGTAGLQDVADLAATSVSTLSAEFGPYPWDELDVVAAPLGSGVGGMEWPGMVWIESTVFGGGIPGLGDLGMDVDELTELLGPDNEIADMLGLGDVGLMMDAMREWTIAHEVGHMWWHALVGNDSITSPVVDEALAQHSACLVERELRPTEADAICDVNTSGQFEQLSMMMGVADGPADQATDDFVSSTQYGALVYGKAPLFYRELEERYGIEATTAALAAVVEEHAFDQITSDQLRTTLGEALDDPAGVDELWQRWIEEAHAAEDLPG